MSNVSKYVFGKSKLGRMKRTIECDANTFNDVTLIPNFKASQRGAVLKNTSNELSSYGINKRSQIDSINGVDISNLPYKKIIKLLNENSSSASSSTYSVSFMIPEQTVETCEIFFRGQFCNNYIDFWCDEHSNNFIVHGMDLNNKNAVKLIENSRLRKGYRVIKVKGIKVVNKKYIEILKMIQSASTDLRVDYGVVFEQGQSEWYNMKKPPSASMRHSQSVANIHDSGSNRRKSANNMNKRRKSSNLMTGKSKHVKKTKSAEINKKNLRRTLLAANDAADNSGNDDLVSGVPMRRNKKHKHKNQQQQFEVGKVTFGTSKLGITRCEIECNSETFVGCDFVPNFKSSQRGAVLKKSNKYLQESFGIVKKSQIESINENEVSAMSYHTIIEGLNELISVEEVFSVVFNIPERSVKTIEMFVRGSLLEQIEFVADEDGNNCIVNKVKNDKNKSVFEKKCKLNKGYRIKQIKTTQVINKKYSEIVRHLAECGKDLRVLYLVIFEEGTTVTHTVSFSNTTLNEEEKEKEKEEIVDVNEEDMPLSVPTQNVAAQLKKTFFNSTDSIGISVIDVDMNVIRKYGNVDQEFVDEDEDEDESEKEDSMIIHSDDTEDDIKQFVPNENEQDVIKENEVVSNEIKKKEREKKDELVVAAVAADETFKSLNPVRTRYVAKVKQICIAAPFDCNQSLLAFKKDILAKIPSHSKLKKEKNLAKRIKFIKLKTPTFPMLIDCDPKDKLCEIATRKDIIVFHTESDDEEKGKANNYFVDQFDD